jgi:serine/threonine protein kinase
MATVYLAHDLKHDRPVALKVLRPELAATLGADRFLREIRLTAGLDPPHHWAVRMARAGVPFELIARQLGYRDFAMVATV